MILALAFSPSHMLFWDLCPAERVLLNFSSVRLKQVVLQFLPILCIIPPSLSLNELVATKENYSRQDEAATTILHFWNGVC